MKLLCKKTILVIDDKYPLIPGKYYTFKKTTGIFQDGRYGIYKLRKDNNWYYSFSDYPKTLTYIWD